MNNLFESVQKAHQSSTDTSGLLQALQISVENLGESVRRMRTEMADWNNPEVEVETE